MSLSQQPPINGNYNIWSVENPWQCLTLPNITDPLNDTMKVTIYIDTCNLDEVVPNPWNFTETETGEWIIQDVKNGFYFAVAELDAVGTKLPSKNMSNLWQVIPNSISYGYSIFTNVQGGEIYFGNVSSSWVLQVVNL